MVQRLSYRLTLRQPVGLRQDRIGPTDKRVETTADMTLTLYTGSPMLHVQANIDQKANDQRLRAVFPMQGVVRQSIADSVFELKRNLCNRVEEYTAPRQKEVPVVVDHSLSMIHLNDVNHTMAFFHRGLHEYQTVSRNEHTELEVTLIRSVSHLSRDDFRSRGGAAGPNLETPDAQVKRSLIIAYAFEVCAGNRSELETLRKANDYRSPAQIIRGHQVRHEASLLAFDNPMVFLTSFRPIGKKQIEARLWNPQSTPQTVGLLSEREIASIHKTQINGMQLGMVNPSIVIDGHEIVTLQILWK